MASKGKIDRKKHEVDITERVLEGGIWAGAGRLESAHIVEVGISTQEGPLSGVRSTVQVRMRASGEDDVKRER